MEKLRKRLDQVANALRLTEAALAVARGRYAKQVTRMKKARSKATIAERRADHLRFQGHPKKAARKDARASALRSRQTKAHDASRVRLGQVKRLNQKVKGLATTAAELRAKLKKLSGPQVEGDTVTGGSPEQRLQKALLTAAARCANGSRRNFYSQPGHYDVEHALSGEQYGDRSDCSQFGAAIYHSCGLDDPNGQGYTGGYTGTLESHGRAVTRHHASTHAGCAALFGPHGATHHVEWSLGDGSEHTVGHGSAPVDMGSFDLLSGPVQFRAYD